MEILIFMQICTVMQLGPRALSANKISQLQKSKTAAAAILNNI